MAFLRSSTAGSCRNAVAAGRSSFRRYLQTHQTSVSSIPHFDPSAIPSDNNKQDATGRPASRDSQLWRRHGFGANAQLPKSEFLDSIFESETAPSQSELQKALKQAQEAKGTELFTPAISKNAAAALPKPVETERAVAAKPVAAVKQTAEKRYRKFVPRKAAMSLTPNAVLHIRQLLEGPSPKLLRVGVRNRGCSGLQYHLEYVDKPGKFDEEVLQDGVKVLIDSKALFSIIGSEMDWVDDKLSNRFVFRNPNIKGECGCGESFMV
ncbi:uncharacterized protein V1518DRAFT_415098 [Limtongia smithiae]|uniref:uncharacterized protein n=1 Tax=Limtongia smithiae TaxID=1125753 RepID=UPI0034CDEF31